LVNNLKLTTMKTLVLGVENTTTIPEKIQKARAIISRMEGNSNFSNPNPALAESAAATTALENAYEEARDGSRLKKIEMQLRDSELKGLIKLLGAYVQNISGGEEAIIVSSGFDAKRARSAPVAADNPTGVHGNATNHAGEVMIRWDKTIGAKSYIAEMSIDGATWTSCGASTSTKLVVGGLVGGSKPLFRIAAIGSTGLSGWSEPGAVRVD
jgi:hypothetical protein